MRQALVVLILIAGLFASPANADPMTAGQLMTRCANLDLSKSSEIKLRSTGIGDALDAGKCWGHIEAYVDLASTELPNSPALSEQHQFSGTGQYVSPIRQEPSG